MIEMSKFIIPEDVLKVSEGLESAGFEAYLVGGCVRDLIIGRTPKDWDITTNATPEKIQEIFPETFYENIYGTVGVVGESEDPTLKIIEVTPYRKEGTYSDARRPDTVEFGVSLEEDLKRRDFTVNAMAYRPKTGELVDQHGGHEDAKKRLIRAVGEPKVRFEEDALRMMRGVRLSAELGFAIEQKTAEAIHETSEQLSKISKERIRDELIRIIETKEPMQALFVSQKLGLLKHISPSLEHGIGIDQNQAHSFDVFEHLLRALQHSADKEWPFIIRLSALFHDVGKPATRRWSEEKKDWTFHGHEVVGARMTRKALTELRFPSETIEKATNLVRWHMFFSDPDKITLSAVRRMIANVGQENIWDLLNLRICDRIGTGRPKEQPFRFRKYKSMVEEALRDPVSVAMLAINGADIMSHLDEKPGPRIGWMLHALLEEVLEDPEKNTKEYLLEKTRVLTNLEDKVLRAMGEEGKEAKAEAEGEELATIRAKYHVD
ncbi:HD domain-containing protein [Patescibacteria group bacterium]|nr:MAG: HD domain-containing protein [Patescibacteria group bacterium]